MSEETGAARARRSAINIRGRGGNSAYVSVKDRVIWFKGEHEDGSIETELVQVSADSALFRAKVTYRVEYEPCEDCPAQTVVVVGTGYGSEERADFGDYIEKAETKAIGRALGACGYDTAAAFADEDPHRGRADAPVQRGQVRQVMAGQVKRIQELEVMMPDLEKVDPSSFPDFDAAENHLRWLREELARRGGAIAG